MAVGNSSVEEKNSKHQVLKKEFILSSVSRVRRFRAALMSGDISICKARKMTVLKHYLCRISFKKFFIDM